MDTRINGTATALRIAIGLMATLAGLDKFRPSLGAFVASPAGTVQVRDGLSRRSVTA